MGGNAESRRSRLAGAGRTQTFPSSPSVTRTSPALRNSGTLPEGLPPPQAPAAPQGPVRAFEGLTGERPW